MSRSVINPPALAVKQRWKPASTLCGQLRGPLREWLLDDGSLTARLMVKSEGQFRVQLLRQYWHHASLSETRLLDIAPRARVLVREVILHGKDEPWVYARSILPYQSLQGPLRRLGKLDSRPLGAFLFSQPGMRRGAIQVSCFPVGSRKIPQNLCSGASAWGRRSIFFIDGKPLLVSEIFLEKFINSL